MTYDNKHCHLIKAIFEHAPVPRQSYTFCYKSPANECQLLCSLQPHSRSFMLKMSCTWGSYSQICEESWFSFLLTLQDCHVTYSLQFGKYPNKTEVQRCADRMVLQPPFLIRTVLKLVMFGLTWLFQSETKLLKPFPHYKQHCASIANFALIIFQEQTTIRGRRRMKNNENAYERGLEWCFCLGYFDHLFIYLIFIYIYTFTFLYLYFKIVFNFIIRFFFFLRTNLLVLSTIRRNYVFHISFSCGFTTCPHENRIFGKKSCDFIRCFSMWR